MKKEFIEMIMKEIKSCEDIALLDLIARLLLKEKTH